MPIGATAGTLQFTLADANITNLTEYHQLVAEPPKSPSQLVSFMNSLRVNTNAYIRVWRPDPAYDVEGETLPDPPPSVGMILARTQPSLSATPALPIPSWQSWRFPGTAWSSPARKPFKWK